MSEVLMSVIRSSLSFEELRELILRNDATFFPMGSGGFGIKETGPGAFIFTQQDCYPYEIFRVRIRNGEVWVLSKFNSFLLSIVSESSQSFTFETKKFASLVEAREAFEKST